MGVFNLPDVTVFYGLYGSGKSEIAINYALRLAKDGRQVVLIDLDAVTPYFRVRDVRDRLEASGVKVVAPKESLRSADLPVLPEGVRRALRQGPDQVVVDVGGDPTGSRVLGGLKDALPPNTRGLFVVNSRRPFTRTISGAKEALELVTNAAGVPASGLVSNTHLAELTTIHHVQEGLAFARELSSAVSLPVSMLCAPIELKDRESEIRSNLVDEDLMFLTRFLLKPWEIEG
jgi:hypothetical protein